MVGWEPIEVDAAPTSKETLHMATRDKARKYTPRQHYTSQELDAAAKADLETDLECAIRDGHQEYADQLRAQLRRIASGESAHKIVLKG